MSSRKQQVASWTRWGIAIAFLGWIFWATFFHEPRFFRPREGIGKGSESPSYFEARYHVPDVISPSPSAQGSEPRALGNHDTKRRTESELEFEFYILKPPPLAFDAIRTQTLGFDAPQTIELKNGEAIRWLGVRSSFFKNADQKTVLAFDHTGKPKAPAPLSEPLIGSIDGRPGEFFVKIELHSSGEIDLSRGSAESPATYTEWDTHHESTGKTSSLVCHSHSWTDAPLSAALDIRYGNHSQATLTFEEGEIASLPSFTAQILAIEPGLWKKKRDAYIGGFDSVSFRKSSDQGTLLRLGVSFRHNDPEPIELKLFDPKGIPLGVNATFLGHHENDQTFYSLPVPPEQIGSMRLTGPRQFHDRLIFHLPGVPGIPEVNQGLDNWFDCRIPYLEVQDKQHLLRILSSASQLGIPQAKPTEGADPSFPRIYRDISIHQLLAEWNRLPNEERLKVDLDYFVLTKRDPWSATDAWEKLLKQIGIK